MWDRRRDGELERAYERFTERLAEVAARNKVGAAPDSRSPVPETPIDRKLDTPAPESERVPSEPSLVPPLTNEERKRAAELEKAKADWAEQDELRDLAPQEYTW